MSALLAVAYEINDPLLIKKLSDAIQIPAYRSKALYKSFLAQVRQPISLAPKPVAELKEHDFAAVGNALAALTEANSAKQNELLTTAQQELLLINDNENKAVATSKVAKYLSRLGKTNDASTLFDRALDSAISIADPAQKNAVLIILATDAGASFLFGQANKFADLISNDDLKKAALEIIKNCERVKELI